MTAEPESIRDTDIVFDCPHCGKSHAIDYRGAGLTIACVDCGRDVEVPIPEGMDIADFDRSAEEQELRIVTLRRALNMAETRIETLERELQTLAAENAGMKARLSQQPDEHSKALLTEMDRIAAAQGHVVSAAANIASAMDRIRDLMTASAGDVSPSDA